MLPAPAPAATEQLQLALHTQHREPAPPTCLLENQNFLSWNPERYPAYSIPQATAAIAPKIILSPDCSKLAEERNGTTTISSAEARSTNHKILENNSGKPQKIENNRGNQKQTLLD